MNKNSLTHYFIQIFKLSVMYISTFSWYFIVLTTNCSPQHHILKHPQSLLGWTSKFLTNPYSHTLKEEVKLQIFKTIFFTILDERWKNKICDFNGSEHSTY